MGPDLAGTLAGNRIDELRAWSVRLPLNRRLNHAGTDTSFLHSVFVRLTLSGGAVGWGEIRANGEYATGEGLPSIEDALGHVGLDGPVEEVVGKMLKRSVLAAAVVDSAMWDARARVSGRPLHSLLRESFGGRPGPDRVDTHAQIMFADGPEVVSSALAQGFHKLKVRAGGDVDDDLRRLTMIREVAGPDVEVTVDANGGWSLDQALAALPGLAELGVTWLEQPVASVDDLRSLHPRTGTVRVRADESVHHLNDLDALDGAVDGVHLKIEKSGTVERLFELAAASADRGLDVALGQMDQGRLGCAHTTHLAAALGLPTAELWGCADISTDAAGPLDLADGAVVVPGRPLTVDLPPDAEELR